MGEMTVKQVGDIAHAAEEKRQAMFNPSPRSIGMQAHLARVHAENAHAKKLGLPPPHPHAVGHEPS